MDNRQLIWNEEIHTFEMLSPGRFTHYVRARVVTPITGPARASTAADDRIGDPHTMSAEEVDIWISERSKPPITLAESEQFYLKWESGTFGPLDNPRADETPKEDGA